MQMIFQDPYASLDPRMTVGQIIGGADRHVRPAKGAARQARIRELMATGRPERAVHQPLSA
jgi:ABC-type microcin C transport system duplicated ATPase subunit YejF